MLTNDDILQIYISANAILKGHFKLASGKHSDTYMQSAKLFMYPEKSRILCNELKTRLTNIAIDIVASPAIGGMLMGYEIASQLNVPNIFFERIENKMTLRRGFAIEKNKNYLVVEDVVTTGGSVMEVVEAIEALGGKVATIVSIVDRSNGKVNFGKTYIPLLQTEVTAWEPMECPLCKQDIPLSKPGTKALSN